MTVTLPPELENYVAEQVHLGVYKTCDECIAAALLVQQQDRKQFLWLRGEIQKGYDSLPDATEGFSAVELINEIQREEGQWQEHYSLLRQPAETSKAS